MSRVAVKRPSGRPGGLELERLVFFSDAVFAIAITLLVLELKPPEREHVHSAAEMWAALAVRVPKLVAFLISFVAIGILWVSHHRVFRYIRRWDERLIVLNLLVLLCVAFLPFPVAIFGNFLMRAQGSAFMMYALSLAAAAAAQALVWHHASSGWRLVDERLDPRLIRFVTLRSLLMPAAFVLAAAVSTFAPQFAMFVPVLAAIPARRLRDRIDTIESLEAIPEPAPVHVPPEPTTVAATASPTLEAPTPPLAAPPPNI